MDFFAQQDLRKRHSLVLLTGFVAAMLAMALLIHCIIAGLSQLLGETGSFWTPSAPAISMIVIIWLAILAGGFFRALDVKAGGAVLARRFGAVHASDRNRHELENRLLNVVAEVAIASTTPQPEVFVLRYETSINAFMLGNTSGRNVIVLTQGALDAFDRDELQAVVAHEFAHIANGDLPLNMRLLIALGGLMAIDEVGRVLIGKGSNNPVHPGTLVGIVLVVIGSIGVFFGKLLRAAFSRQREFMADACAVQFTRNPLALASALSIVQDRETEPTLHSRHIHELAHLCFQSRQTRLWYKSLLATHPSLQSRIDTIDPHADVKLRLRLANLNKSDSAFPSIDEVAKRPLISVVDAGGGLDAANASGHAASPILSDRIFLLLPDEGACIAALFAVFADKDPGKRCAYLNSLAFSFDQEMADKVKQVLGLLPEEFSNDQLGIINRVTELLRNKLDKNSRNRIIQKIEQLVIVSEGYDLVSYATVQLIRRKLDVEFPIVNIVANEKNSVAQARKVKSFDAMGSEFALLLSLIVESSGASAEKLDEQFQRVLKCYTLKYYPRRTANETGIVDDLEAAFQTLYVQPKSIRQAFVQHCIEIMQQDGQIVPNERALLGLFAASLCCEELIAA